MPELTIRTEETPNPNARRYVVDRPVQEESKGRFFTSVETADDPLAQVLFGIEGVTGVMLLPNSVTINKSNSLSWEDLDPAARDAITGYFE